MRRLGLVHVDVRGVGQLLEAAGIVLAGLWECVHPTRKPWP